MTDERDDLHRQMKALDHLQQRAGRLAQQYRAAEDKVREAAGEISARSAFTQPGYIAGRSHALILEIAEEHEGCAEAGCRLCVLITDALVLILATDQARIDDRFAQLIYRLG